MHDPFSARALSLNIHKTMVRCGLVIRWQVKAQSCSIDMSKNEQDMVNSAMIICTDKYN